MHFKDRILLMNNSKIISVAMAQSATDLGCASEDFKKSQNIIVESTVSPDARRYLNLPFICDLVSYGNNVVASVDMKYKDIVKSYINRFAPEHCFETPNLHILNDAFQSYGMRICFMAEYFLPRMDILRELSCRYELRVMYPDDFNALYTSQWSNALCADRKSLDVLCVGAYDGNRLIGLAGASADCDTMWQIGVDVLPEYRRQGVAAALTSRLALEITACGKVPFYCCAWSNIKSAGNAIKSGFRPAWVEMTVKPSDFVNKLNGTKTE